MTNTIQDITSNRGYKLKILSFLNVLIISILMLSFVNNIEVNAAIPTDDSIFINSTITLDYYGSGLYKIEKIEHLYMMRYHLSSGFILMNDLDFSDLDDYANSGLFGDFNNDGTSGFITTELTDNDGWVPIGLLSSNFTGTFDGNNHSIDGLFINLSAEKVGLFANTSGATILDLGLTNVDITGTQFTGGLVGIDNNSTFNNVYVTGDIRGTSSVGALTGSSLGTTYNNCFSSGSVIGSGNRIGGLIGGSERTEINNSYSNTDVTGVHNVGGLVGRTSSATGISTIDNSYATGLVIGNTKVGGLVGQEVNGSILRNSLSVGFVSGVSTVGALVGDYISNTITNSWYLDYNDDPVYNNIGDGATFEQISSGLWLNNLLNSGLAFEINQNVNSDKLPLLKNDVGVVLSDQSNTYLSNARVLDAEEKLDFVGISYNADGSGLYEVETIEQLYAMRYHLSSGFILLNDLDYSEQSSYAYPDMISDWNGDNQGTESILTQLTSGLGWVPIGVTGDKFSGSFDGNGKTISNLFINRSTDNVGLFGSLSGAIISNIGLLDVDITGSVYTAGLVGTTYNGSTVINSYSIGKVNGTGPVGGLVGMNYASSVMNSYTGGIVNGSLDVVGGLVGNNIGIGGTALIKNSYSSANVSGAVQVGGLVGRSASTNTGDTLVINSYSTGTVTGNSDVGGLVGVNKIDDISLITNSYSVGLVSGVTNIGGIVGVGVSEDLSNSFYYDDGSDNGYNSIGSGVAETEFNSGLWQFDVLNGSGAYEIDSNLTYTTFPMLKSSEGVLLANQEQYHIDTLDWSVSNVIHITDTSGLRFDISGDNLSETSEYSYVLSGSGQTATGSGVLNMSNTSIQDGVTISGIVVNLVPEGELTVNITITNGTASKAFNYINVVEKVIPTITLINNNGSGNSILNTELEGSVFTEPTSPSKTYHSFLGWYTDIGLNSQYTFNVYPNADLSLYAGYTVNQHVLTQNEENNTFISSGLYNYNSGVTASGVATIVGYTHSGWSSGLTLFDSGLTDFLMPDSDVTVTATYTVNQYEVKYVASGLVIQSGLFNYGSGISETNTPSVPSETGYSGAWDDLSGSVSNSLRTITAIHTVNQYEVEFTNIDNEFISSGLYNYGSGLSEVTKPSIPTITGYTGAWNDDFSGTVPTTKTIIKAVYTINTHALTQNEQSGVFIHSGLVNYSSGVVAQTPVTITGYTHSGWNSGVTEYAKNLSDFTMPDSDVTLTATYTVTQSVIEYLTYNGTHISSGLFNYGSGLSETNAPAIPVRVGYTTVGWDNNLSGTVTENNLSITATYTVNQYEVKYVTYSGAHIISGLYNFGSGLTDTGTPTIPDRAGYDISGWDVSLAGTVPANNITIKASYTVKTSSPQVYSGPKSTKSEVITTIEINVNTTSISIYSDEVLKVPTYSAVFSRGYYVIDVTDLVSVSNVNTTNAGIYTLEVSVTYDDVSISEFIEVLVTDRDSDNDGFTDKEEVSAGSNVNNHTSVPTDRDGDGFTNNLELTSGSNPDNYNSVPNDLDGDGYSNEVEVIAGSNPLNLMSVPLDIDGNGILDAEELDSDADGIVDIEEIIQGTDPLDSTSVPSEYTVVTKEVYIVIAGVNVPLQTSDAFDLESLIIQYIIANTRPDEFDPKWELIDFISLEGELELSDNVYILLSDDLGHKDIQNFTDSYLSAITLGTNEVLIDETVIHVLLGENIVTIYEVPISIDDLDVEIISNGDTINKDDARDDNQILSNGHLKFVKENSEAKLVIFDMTDSEFLRMKVYYREKPQTTILAVLVNASAWKVIEIEQGYSKYIELPEDTELEIRTELFSSTEESEVSEFTIELVDNQIQLDITTDSNSGSYILFFIFTILAVTTGYFIVANRRK